MSHNLVQLIICDADLVAVMSYAISNKGTNILDV